MRKFNEIKLRGMTVEDLPAVMVIENSRNDLPWLEDTMRDCIKANFECLVVKKNDCLIAYSIMALRNGEAHVFNICVLPQEQRKGYGRYIMQQLLAKARSKKVQKVILKVRESNKTAYQLYWQLGFRLIDRLVDYYDVPEGKDTALVLALKINTLKR